MIKAIYIDAENKSIDLIEIDETRYNAADGWFDIVKLLGYVDGYYLEDGSRIFAHDYDCNTDKPGFVLDKSHDTIRQRISEGAVIVCQKGKTEEKIEELKAKIVWLEPLEKQNETR